jgi:hypothetical protein
MPVKRTIYHVKDGAAEMWAVDADATVRQHPKEWSTEPWAAQSGADDAKKAAAAAARKRNEDVAAAKDLVKEAQKAVDAATTDDAKKAAEQALADAQVELDKLSKG